MRAAGLVLVVSASVSCLVEKETVPGFCGPDVKCPQDYTCSEQRGPTWRRCVCISSTCADAGVDGVPDGRDAPRADTGDALMDVPGAEGATEQPPDTPADTGPACTTDKDCSAGRPHCNPTGDCVACLSDGHCKDPASSFCVSGACAGCSVAPAGACAMRSAATPACGPAGSCVECVASADCASDLARPICAGGNKCVRCTSDPQCAAKPGGPGLCMSHQDGRCASDAETIYVQNKAGCATAPPGGTAATPFCGAQTAVDQVTPSRRVIVVLGPAAVGGFSWSVAPGVAQVTAAGRAGAVISGGGPVVKVTGGDLFMRGVTVTAGSDTGIVAEAGATLHLRESSVDGNAKGGIRTAASSFEIVNCIITNNGLGGAGPVSFGGAYLDTAPPGGPKQFDFNTVVGNKAPGVVCAASTQSVIASQLWANSLSDAMNCAVALSKTSADPDPMLTKIPPLYRLTAMSPCRNAVMPAPAGAPAVDIDGVARPQEGVFDCGASEFK